MHALWSSKRLKPLAIVFHMDQVLGLLIVVAELHQALWYWHFIYFCQKDRLDFQNELLLTRVSLQSWCNCFCRLRVEGAGRQHLCCFIRLEMQRDLQVCWEDRRCSPAVWWEWECSMECKLLRDRQLFLQTQEGYTDTWRGKHMNAPFPVNIYIFCKYKGYMHY